MISRRFALAAAIASALSPVTLMADELPALKAGLWETRMESKSGALPTTTFKQCMDGKIDIEAVMKQTGGMCKMSWQRVGDTIETENSCAFGPVSSKGKGVITGDFNSKLRIETVSTTTMGELPPGMPKLQIPTEPQTMLIEATWLGPCEEGQKPGDVIMPNGQKMQMPAIPAMPK